MPMTLSLFGALTLRRPSLRTVSELAVVSSLVICLSAATAQAQSSMTVGEEVDPPGTYHTVLCAFESWYLGINLAVILTVSAPALPQPVSQTFGPYYDVVTGSMYVDIPDAEYSSQVVNCEATVLNWTNYSNIDYLSTQITIQAPAGCGDARDTMIEEYRAGQVAFTPTCADFSSSGDSPNFSWSELNGHFSTGNPHNPWGIIRDGLRDGLENTRSNYNRGGIRLSSGYRCPHGNAQVGGAQQSYHVHGRAADMYSDEHPWTEDEFALLREAAQLTGPIELFNWTTYTDNHLHAAW